MKLIPLFAIAACLLMIVPGATASERPQFDAAAPCPSITSIGVVPYAICMITVAAELAENSVILVCDTVFGPNTCSKP